MADKSALDIIKAARETIKSQEMALIGDIQKSLQSLANNVKEANEITGKNVLTDPAFGQALDELGVVLKGTVVEKVKKPKGEAKPLPPVKDSELGKKIALVVKKKGKCDAAAVVDAIGTDAKPATVKNYLSRLCTENVLYHPERGMFSIK